MGLLTSDIEAVVIQLDKVGQPFVGGDVVTGSVLVGRHTSLVVTSSKLDPFHMHCLVSWGLGHRELFLNL